LSLDEGRALIRADEANFWRYLEKDQMLELSITRDRAKPNGKKPPRIPLTSSIMGSAALKRSPVLDMEGRSSAKTESQIAVPLLIGTEMWGVFHYVRTSPEKMTQRDLDLITLFIRQLGMAVENRDLVKNHEKFYLELVQSLADVLDSRDATTEGQTRRARNLARGIAKAMELPEDFIYYLEFAALLHDIGNIAIDEHLFKKPGKLTSEEFALIKKHPELGYKILSSVSMLAPVASMVLYHQERYDGTGYPDGLQGEEIPLGARIVAVLDAWMSMTSSRPFRKALSADDAMREIKKGAGNQFDPVVVDAFVQTLESQGMKVLS
jgi:HD-GYP domain-containing protein (c-di-GMP phosphodiesterase class II)